MTAMWASMAGILNIFKRMGASLEIVNVSDAWEPAGDIKLKTSRLKATTVDKDEIPRCIDELPALIIAAVFAEGKTLIKGAGELRVKETDRIESMIFNLRKMGARLSSKGDDIVIEGTGNLEGADLKSFLDHRTVMALTVAAQLADGESSIDDVQCVNTSFPGFFDILESIAIN